MHDRILLNNTSSKEIKLSGFNLKEKTRKFNRVIFIKRKKHKKIKKNTGTYELN